jgi:hypothetical protein
MVLQQGARIFRVELLGGESKAGVGAIEEALREGLGLASARIAMARNNKFALRVRSEDSPRLLDLLE